MYVVIFEFTVKPESKPRYFELAAQIRAELSHQSGFISIDRFEHTEARDSIVSISTWESLEAIKSWRENKTHQQAQAEGKSDIFSHYRLRVAEVLRDYDFAASD